MGTFLKKITVLGLIVLALMVTVSCNDPESTTESTTSSSSSEIISTTTIEDITSSTEVSTETWVYEIVNGEFETGDLTGWTILAGDAFSNNGVIDSTFVSGTNEYHKDGEYLYGIYEETSTGRMRSTGFIVGGCGYISFKLGAGYNPGLTYISIVETGTDIELYRFSNQNFNQANYNSYLAGNDEASLNGYIADLSDIAGIEV